MNRAPRVGHCAIVTGVLLWAATVGGCKESPSPQRSPALRKIRVALSPHLSWGPLMMAKEEGFFSEEGLDVEFISLLRSEESLVALLSGDVDVVPGPLHPGLFSAVTRGGAVRIVGGMNFLARNGCTYHGLVLRPGLSPAQADHRIRRLDASRDGASRYLTSRMLATRGIDIDTLETIKLPSAVTEHSLQTGAVDAAAVTEPFLTRTSRHGVLWLRAQDATPDFQWAVISFGDRLLRRDRDTGVRFLVAFRRGVEQFNSGKTAHNLEVLGRATQEDRGILEQSCWPAFRADARVNLESVLGYQQWAREHRYLDQSATLEQLWDSSFVVASDTAVARHRGSQTKE